MPKAEIYNQPKVFTVWSDKIKKRIDPYFYNPFFIKIINSIENLNFKRVKLVEIADIFSGARPKGGVGNISTGVPSLGGEHVLLTGEIKIDKLKFIPQDFHDNHLNSAVKSNDIILVKDGATTGKVGIIPLDYLYKECNINEHVFAIRIKDIKNIIPEYIFAFLASNLGQVQIKREITGATVTGLTRESVKNLKIPLPSLKIQNKIVNVIQKAYLDKKEKEIEANELLESIDNYVLDELGIKMPEINKEMVFKIMSDKVENSRMDVRYWQPFLEEIKQIINKGKYKTQKLKIFITKIHYGASTSNAYVDGGIPLLSILNLKLNHFNISNVVYLPENFRKKLGNAFVDSGDLLISRSGTVGVVSVVPKEVDGFAFGSFMIKFCLNDKINKEFVSIWLNNKLNKFLTEREKIGAVQGNITIGTIKNFDIPVPPLTIQNKIVEKVQSYYSQAQKLKDEASSDLQKAKNKVEEMILG